MTRKVSSSNFQNQRVLGEACVLNDALYRVGMRWKMQVLYAIAHGRQSFSALKRELPSVSDQVLGKRLRELVEEGLVDKREQGKGLARYTPTARGTSLLAIMAELCAWEGSASRPT